MRLVRWRSQVKRAVRRARRRPRPIGSRLLAGALPLVAAVAGAQQIYRWTDENGKVHFGSHDPEIARIMRHEYAHAVIIAVSGGHCPVWLNEGAAMWAEEEQDGDREEWALGAIQLHRPFRLAEIERLFVRLSPQQAATAYAQSYLAVRHLVARYGELPVQRLLAAFATSASPADAFRQALGIELAALEAELLEQHAGR